MDIRVGRKWESGAEYIGRGSPLGNPFKMLSERDRDAVCDSYVEWIKEKIKDKDPEICAELNRLYRLAKTRSIILGCFCSPKRCHGDTIREILLNPQQYK